MVDSIEKRLYALNYYGQEIIPSEECVELAQFCEKTWHLPVNEVDEIAKAYCFDDAVSLASSLSVENHHVAEGEFFRTLYKKGIIEEE